LPYCVNQRTYNRVYLSSLTLKKSILFLVISLSFACNRSSESIYEAMFKSRPESVVVFHAQDQAFLDCCIWMHFKIDKSDLRLLIDSCEQGNVDFKRWTLAETPKWWKPENLKGDVKYFTRTVSHGRRSRNFYVNSDYTEVYYVDRAGH
jgi:hypothetical protein